MTGCREGDVYKVLRIGECEFTIRYGYYSEEERSLWEPTPIFPDFLQTPQYTVDGYAFVTASQDVCEHYRPRERVSGENWCHDCRSFTEGAELIGWCRCQARKRGVRQNE